MSDSVPAGSALSILNQQIINLIRDAVFPSIRDGLAKDKNITVTDQEFINWLGVPMSRPMTPSTAPGSVYPPGVAAVPSPQPTNQALSTMSQNSLSPEAGKCRRQIKSTKGNRLCNASVKVPGDNGPYGAYCDKCLGLVTLQKQLKKEYPNLALPAAGGQKATTTAAPAKVPELEIEEIHIGNGKTIKKTKDENKFLIMDYQDQSGAIINLVFGHMRSGTQESLTSADVEKARHMGLSVVVQENGKQEFLPGYQPQQAAPTPGPIPGNPMVPSTMPAPTPGVPSVATNFTNFNAAPPAPMPMTTTSAPNVSAPAPMAPNVGAPAPMAPIPVASVSTVPNVGAPPPMAPNVSNPNVSPVPAVSMANMGSPVPAISAAPVPNMSSPVPAIPIASTGQ